MPYCTACKQSWQLTSEQEYHDVVEDAKDKDQVCPKCKEKGTVKAGKRDKRTAIKKGWIPDPSKPTPQDESEKDEDKS